MIRTLAVVVITFLGLGIYYASGPSRSTEVANPVDRQNARSAAVSGVNVAKEALATRWEGGRHAGRQEGATYRVATVVRGETSSINSVGTVERRARVVARHQIRIGLVRKVRTRDGSVPDYRYVVRMVDEPDDAENG